MPFVLCTKSPNCLCGTSQGSPRKKGSTPQAHVTHQAQPHSPAPSSAGPRSASMLSKQVFLNLLCDTAREKQSPTLTKPQQHHVVTGWDGGCSPPPIISPAKK